VNDPFFSFVSLLIAVPTGVKFFNWIATMWGGSLTFPTPMLFAVGFLLNFLLGGITGVMIASPPIDFQAHESYFIVAHMHYVLGGGSLFAIFAALFFWWPKMFGHKLDERLGKWCFWLLLVGFNVTFFPMHFMGIEGMPRRVFTYESTGQLPLLNAIATAGSYVMLAGVLVFAWNAGRRRPVGCEFARVDHHLATARVQLHGAAPDPQRAARVRRAGESRGGLMLVGRRLFISSAAFGIVLAIAYWLVAHEISGAFLLGFMAFALTFLAGYMIVSEREADFWGDDRDAAHPDAEGNLLGTYTIRSPLPICAALAITMLVLGVVISPTLAIVSIIAILALGALFIVQSV
jgi:hypothetical protein